MTLRSPVLVALTILLAPAAGEAQDGVSGHLSVGPTFPTGLQGDTWSPGLQLHAGAEHWLSPRWALGVEGSVSRLPSRSSVPVGATATYTADGLDMVQLLATVRFSPLVPSADRSWRPYLRAGLGYTLMSFDRIVLRVDGEPDDVRRGDTDYGPGGMIGAGVSYRLARRLALYAEGRLAFDTDDGPDSFLPVTAGVELAF